MTRIRMKGDLRQVSLLLCGSIGLLIIFYSYMYAHRSDSGSGTTKDFIDRSVPNIRENKMIYVIHEGKTNNKPIFKITKQTGIKTMTKVETISAIKLEVNGTTKLQAKPVVNTRTELNLEKNDLRKQLLTRHTHNGVENRPNITDSSLAKTHIVLAKNQSEQRHISEGRTAQDFVERFNNGKPRLDVQRKDQHRLPLKYETAKRLTKVQSKSKTVLDSLSEAEIQTLLKSELQASNSTEEHNAEMTSRFQSVGRTILIIGYHRTGSSLIGTTFKIYPGIFYLFEPLNMLRVATHLTFINGTRILNVPEYYRTAEADVLHSLLTCSLHQLPLEVLMHSHHVHHTDSLEHTVYCLQRYMSNFVRGAETIVSGSLVNNKSSVIYAFSAALSRMRNADAVVAGIMTRCLTPVIEYCMKSAVRVYKLIQLRIPRIKNILRDTNDVGVVHLSRDPRGNIPSQANLIIPSVMNMQPSDIRDKQLTVTRTAYFKEFISIANKYCSEVRTDMASVQKFPRQYGYRIRTVLYERFASAPLTTARALYTFAGLPFLNLTEDYMWQLTLSGHRTTCSYCVERGNATHSAFKWRETIKSTQLRIIDELCRDLYHVMGLRELRHLTDVRNMSVPILL